MKHFLSYSKAHKLFWVVLITLFYCFPKFSHSQELSLNIGLGAQIFGSRYFQKDYNNQHLKSNKYLMPNFQYALEIGYKHPLFKKHKFFLVGSLEQSRTRFYYAIRAEHDWTAYHYENVFFNFNASTLRIGLSREIALKTDQILLNIGFNTAYKINHKTEVFKGSNEFPLEEYNSESEFSDNLYNIPKWYQYRVFLKQPRVNLFFDMNLDVYFKISNRLKLQIGFQIPLIENWYFHNISVDYNIRSSQFIGQYTQFEYLTGVFYRFSNFRSGLIFNFNR